MEYLLVSLSLRAPPTLPTSLRPHVAGNVECLGQWNPDNMLPMMCRDSESLDGGHECWRRNWSLSFVLATSTLPFHYRFALLYGDTADHLSLWETGENRREEGKVRVGRERERMTATFHIPKYLWPVWGQQAIVKADVGVTWERLNVCQLALGYLNGGGGSAQQKYWETKEEMGGDSGREKVGGGSAGVQRENNEQLSKVVKQSLSSVYRDVNVRAEGLNLSGSDEDLTRDGSATSPRLMQRAISRSFSECSLLRRTDTSESEDSEALPYNTVMELPKLAICLVGLPARGKTFTAVKLTRFLQWLGHETKHFNVGEYRRKYIGQATGEALDFFNPDNEHGKEARNRIAQMAMEDLLNWMQHENGEIGIYDATNSSSARRNMLMEMAKDKCKIVFVESRCNDKERVRQSILTKIKASPDYAAVPTEVALKDFEGRLAHYERGYHPMSSENSKNLSYIVMSDVGSKEGCKHLEINNITGYMEARICYYLLNTHLETRKIYLTRHGQSVYNTQNRIGGDAPITELGEQYAEWLVNFLDGRDIEDRPQFVWTSRLRRTIMTARHLGAYPQVQLRALDEIDAGICDGMSYEEVKRSMSEEWEARKSDKLHYRYPRGEGYLDVIQRLEPIIIEIERQKAPIMLIAHQAVLRALYAYFMGKPLEEVPYLSIPLHTVIELQPAM